jgi:DNA-nicking Smr family endonuclease
MTRKPIVPDFELWETVKASVLPISGKKPDSEHRFHVQSPPVKSEIPLDFKPKMKPAASSKLLPLTGIDRRTKQKLSRGKAAIDAKLDLHGYTIETARVELQRFLSRVRNDGLTMALVITGKGDSPYARHTLHSKDVWHSPERSGKLRRAVTSWFEEPEFRLHIAGYQPAHPRHGGGGAYYVRLRRKDQK